VNAFPLVLLTVSAALLTGVMTLVRRGLATNRAWADAIADHVEATGQHPSVAEWRAGRLRAPLPTPQPLPSGPATVTVTVVEPVRAELSGGAR
jgi:hypothetical protein